MIEKTKIRRVLEWFRTKKMIKGIFWSFLGVFISKGFVFLSMFFIARLMDVKDFGKIGVLQSYMSTFVLLSLASFGVTATKYLALYVNTDKRKASEIYSLIRTFVWVLSALIVGVNLCFSNNIANLMLKDSNMSLEVVICSIAIFFSSLNGLQVGALTGLESFKNVSIVNIVNGILSLPLIIFFVKNLGVTGFAISVSIVNFSIWLCSAILLSGELKRNGIWFTLKGFKQNFLVIKEFSVPAFLSNLMVTPTILICNSFLMGRHNGSYEMGVFNAANNFYNILSILLGVLGNVFYPYAMKNFGKENKKFEFVNIVNSFYFALMIGLPIICIPEIAVLLFGKQYDNSNMRITSVLVVMFSIINAQKMGIARNFAAGNFMWFSVVSNGIWAVSAILFSFILLKFGAIGRGTAFCLAYLLNTLVFVPFFIKKRLVDRRLLATKYNLYFLFTVSIATVFSILEFSLITRASILIACLVSVNFLTYRWYNSYVNNYKVC